LMQVRGHPAALILLSLQMKNWQSVVISVNAWN